MPKCVSDSVPASADPLLKIKTTIPKKVSRQLEIVEFELIWNKRTDPNNLRNLGGPMNRGQLIVEGDAKF